MTTQQEQVLARLESIEKKLDYVVERQRWTEELLEEMSPIARLVMLRATNDLAAWEEVPVIGRAGDLQEDGDPNKLEEGAGAFSFKDGVLECNGKRKSILRSRAAFATRSRMRRVSIESESGKRASSRPRTKRAMCSSSRFMLVFNKDW